MICEECQQPIEPNDQGVTEVIHFPKWPESGDSTYHRSCYEATHGPLRWPASLSESIATNSPAYYRLVTTYRVTPRHSQRITFVDTESTTIP